jgi:AcrR family transcriptional regulator
VTSGTTRGRPRDASVDERVLAAVVTELGAVGVSGFSVNAVSDRAGVAKRTISVRWPDRKALILAGMDSLAAHLTPPHTGYLDTDLAVLAVQIVATMSEPRRSILARCAAELRTYPQYYEAFVRESVDRCMAAVCDVLFDAGRRGELRPEVDLALVAECFVGAILGVSTLTARGVTDPSAIADRLVALIIGGIGAPPARQVEPVSYQGVSSDE